MSFDKQGALLGPTMATFIATIAIILILLVFVFVSGIVKTVSNTTSGEKIRDEDGVGLGDVEDYVEDDYVKLTKVRLELIKGEGVDKISEVVDYGWE